jgi:hypothetical protein
MTGGKAGFHEEAEKAHTERKSKGDKSRVGEPNGSEAQKSFVEEKLADELERLKRLLGLESGLKVVWVPVSGGGLSGEVKGNMIYVYECEMDGALQTLRHELVDYLITSKIVEPLVGLVNMLIKSREAEIYREKEKLVEIFSKLLFNR